MIIMIISKISPLIALNLSYQLKDFQCFLSKNNPIVNTIESANACIILSHKLLLILFSL